MLSLAEKILKYNPGEKSWKAPFTIDIDLECLLKKEESCQNNPEKSYTEKKLDMNLQVGQCLKENKLDYYRGKDCIEKLCKKMKERVMEIINYKK